MTLRVSEVATDKEKQNWFVYEYQRPALTVDAVCLYTSTCGHTEVLLVKRADNPYKGHWALPGGFMEIGETCDDAIKRELREETGIQATDVIAHDIYDDVYRDTRSRVITRTYIVLFTQKIEPTAGDDAAEARWISLDEAKKQVLAFDHNKILKDAHGKYKLMCQGLK